jgi:hypothetical protein
VRERPPDHRANDLRQLGDMPRDRRDVIGGGIALLDGDRDRRRDEQYANI